MKLSPPTSKTIVFWAFIFTVLLSCSKREQEEALIPELQETDSYYINQEETTSFAKHLNLSTANGNPSRASIQSNNQASVNVIKSIKLVKDSNNINAFYIINYKDKGFLISSADKRTPQILAFSETGNFSTHRDSISPGTDTWLFRMKRDIQAIRRNKTESIEYVRDVQEKSASRQVQSTGTSIVFQAGPLLQTSWGQGSGYNDYTPILNCSQTSNNRAWTGCVATAIAQVMNYHKFPSSYNWDIMPNQWGANETARLMYDVGIVANMQYGCDGSGTSGQDYTASTFNHFGYANGIVTRPFSRTGNNDFDYPQINAIVKTEISSNRPVIFSGGHQEGWWIFSNYAGGHEWVCDGIQTSRNTTYKCVNKGRAGVVCEYVSVDTHYLHMNWGWNGANNGYFALGSFNPTPDGFNYGTVLYYGIKKPN